MLLLTFHLLLASIVIYLPQSRLVYKGIDISSLLELESQGRNFKSEKGEIERLEVILEKAGFNTIRQRVWVNPVNNSYNLDYNLKLAKRVKAAGMQTYLDLHFSDTWADPEHQTRPVAWAKLSMDALCSAVYQHTHEVSEAFSRIGIIPKIISIGNEINNGMLWDIGTIKQPKNLASLLQCASKGIRESSLGQQTKIMIHTAKAWDKGMQLWFFDLILSTKSFALDDFDMIGGSFYPFFGPEASLDALRKSLKALESTYPNKELVIAETNWPFSCPGRRATFPPDTKNIPFSAVGQVQWMKQISEVMQELKNGVGILYWEGAWVTNWGLGSPCYDNLIFDGVDGKARNSISMASQM